MLEQNRAEDGGQLFRGLILADEVYAIVGAAMEVYNSLGSGFLESVYQEALEMELQDRGIPFRSQYTIPMRYKERPMKRMFIADLVCYDQVIVELKAVDRITGKEESQIINYLRGTGCMVGVILNFGSHRKLEWKRYVHTDSGRDTNR